MTAIKRWLGSYTGGEWVFPLAVLFLIFFFDEFDTGAFSVLAPNIEHAFHLTDRQYGAVVVVNLSIVFLLAVPVGYFGDRIKRVLIVVASAILAGTFSLLTGIVTSLVLLYVVRIGNGVGRLANDPIHTSLLSDYYAPDHRPRVFSIHRNAVYLGAILGSGLAGVLSAAFGWRAAFEVLIAPIVITAIVATRLREPRRGGTDDADAAVEAEREPPVPFPEARRTLFAVRTLKRQYWAWVFIGAGTVPLAIYLPLYLQRVYHLSDLSRGVVVAVDNAATFAGVLIGGRWAQRWLAQSLGEPLRRAGIALAVVGPVLVVFAAAPWLGLALAVGLVGYFSVGVFFPAFLTVQALVSPARVRSLSFSFGAVFLFVGGAGFVISPLGSLSDNAGIRWGVGATAPFFLIGGLVLASAMRFVTDDTTKAFRALTATVELRRQRLEAKERSLLVCVGVDVAYDSVQVLFGVDFTLGEGEIVALLGTNGAGKSTLLKAISGLVDPAGGAILFDGRDITHMDAKERVKLGIIQMPGGKSVFPTLTVNECLRLAGWLYRSDPAHVAEATARALAYFPRLAERGDALAGNLSGGEQQQLGLAMALISKPRLLMIDELSLGLAPTVVGLLVDIVREIHKQGTTIILVEQSVNVALTLAQRAVFMEKGEVRFSGATADLLERGDILRSVFLEGAASATGVSIDTGASDPKTNGNGNGAAPHRLPASVRRSQALAKPVVLDVRSIMVRFGGVTAVDGASFELHRDEILGLIGPNGAGKTTIFDAISGFVPLRGGTIRFDEQDVSDWSPDRRARAGLGRSFQDARIFPSMTVAENIAVALERHLEVRDPFAAALGLPAVTDTETEVAWKVADLVDLLNLGAFRNKFVGELSTGSRRIVDLAMAIAHDPKVLILDEPSSGIAQRETEALGPLLLRIRREVGCAMLVIEHDMPLITSVADSMLALELGRVIAEGTPDEVVNHPQVVASYLGTNEAAISRSGDVGEKVPVAVAAAALPSPPPAGNGKPAGAARKATTPRKAAAAKKAAAARTTRAVKRPPAADR